MGFTIGLATAADTDRVAPLFDAYRQFYGLPPDLPLCRQYLAERLGRDESVVLLATGRAANDGSPIVNCRLTLSVLRLQP
jgi:hypothetical protein